MTTIAFDGRYLAADTLWVRGGNRSEQPSCKIAVHGASAFGFGGLWGHYRGSLLAWFGSGAEDGCPAKDVEGAMLVVMPMRGLLVFTDQAPYPDPEAWPFAIGTGGDIALGAMGAGVTAMEAVKLAMRWDLKTGGEVDFIDTERLDKGVQRWDGTMPSARFPMPVNTPLTTISVNDLPLQCHVELDPRQCVNAHDYELKRGLLPAAHGSVIVDDLTDSSPPPANMSDWWTKDLTRRNGVIGRAEMCTHGYVRSTCSQCRANTEANLYPV